MCGDPQDDHGKDDKAAVIQEIIPVGPDNVTLAQDGGIQEALFFLRFLLYMLIKRCHQDGILRMAFHTKLNGLFFWLDQVGHH